ncbi:uncharacterized protein CTRU02_214915 [Colletotrichum truncatum]|uniref:Uncharacterized protein n=1 Tax=Colletotrichum truncatum TaxID=5467 RepID=A0ACC3YE31_COLTU
MWNEGKLAAQILAHIQAEDRALAKFTSRDIDNLLADHRQAELAGKTPIAWLSNHLKDSPDYWSRCLQDDSGHVTALFISPRRAISLLLHSPDFLMMDWMCTFNRFDVPLFVIRSRTLDGHIFQNMKSIFQRLVPHLLCSRQVNLDISANTRRHFPKVTKGQHLTHRQFLDKWNSVLQSKTTDAYKDRVAALATDGFPAAAVDYVADTWLHPWKTKLVARWIDKVRHFGSVDTWPCNSASKGLKREVSCPTGDLRRVFDKMALFCNTQYDTINLDYGRQERKSLCAASHLTFDIIRHLVCPTALSLLLIELRKMETESERGKSLAVKSIEKPQDACKPCSIMTTHGLPCYHVIWEFAGKGLPLPVTKVHTRWLWEARLPPNHARGPLPG